MNLKLVRHIPEEEIKGINWEVSIGCLQSHANTFFAFPLSNQGIIIKVKGDGEDDETIIQSLPDAKDFEIVVPLPMITYSRYRIRALRFAGLAALNKDWKFSVRDHHLKNEFSVENDNVLLKPTGLFSVQKNKDILRVKKNTLAGQKGVELVIKSGEK